MAYAHLPDGSLHCDVCNVEFRRPHACRCAAAPRVTVDPTLVPFAEMERLTAQATADGMLDRLALERLLANRVTAAIREAKAYRRAMRRCLERGVVRMGNEGPVDADADGAAVKWGTLAESAEGRADKTVRALYGIVADRERRADLERRERLAELAIGRPRAQPRGTA